MLRIPPTRVELKHEDIKEYDQVAQKWQSCKKHGDKSAGARERQEEHKKKLDRHNRMGI